MGYRRLTTILDIAKAGYWLKIACPCGHERRLEPMRVIERLSRRGADVRLSHLQQSLKCGKCGGKDFVASHCTAPEAWSR